MWGSAVSAGGDGGVAGVEALRMNCRLGLEVPSGLNLEFCREKYCYIASFNRVNSC